MSVRHPIADMRAAMAGRRFGPRTDIETVAGRNVKAHWHNSGLEVSCCCKSTPNGALVMPKAQKQSSFDVMGLLTQHNTRWTSSNYQEDQIVYAQGDPADSVFYI